MKKLLITMIALVGLVAFSGCSKDEPTNLFKGTKWTAPDDIAEMIYGGTCTTSIEFLTDSKCQEIRVNVLWC
ncbi:hypothetical protein HQ45_06810 [Porphyromonas crevioricanis]|uniref:hypothetical protein n=1 Tax=Porphyromonas crevioricanis TaxID=393921 RepID=UPI00052D81BD|nr:hypothetical protein [Porphyromonas crevioricanis]KGN89691.1 hypothetical protein HQ45_06810 [Porphyromonas crevioricanis]